MNLYSISRPVVRLFYRLCFRYTVEGREHIPKHGAVIICSNHLSNFDPPFIGICSPRTLSFLAKEELFKVPVLGWLVRNLHAVPVNRGAGDRQAIRTALRLLREGCALLIFPEGHRNRGPNLNKGLSGAGFFALKTDATVIPCAIIGKYKFQKPMKVVFGPPIETDSMKRRKMKSSEASAIIMSHIERLLEENRK
ncbi:1-acyl-sn-glycerol-3-phosphate acyltransferase [Sporolactobacillus sp. THM7-7]|nr:1-acyl-sn-glycerol-3-phosphate acyltransferase [Sporolactobacillus sp. THM7-7]